MKTRFWKKPFALFFVLIMSAVLMTSAYAGTAFGGTVPFPADGNSYVGNSVINTNTSTHTAYGGATMTCTTGAVTAGYMSLDVILMNDSWSVLEYNYGTNSDPTVTYALYTPIHYGSGYYCAQGMAAAYKPSSGTYSSAYVLSTSPLIYA